MLEYSVVDSKFGEQTMPGTLRAPRKPLRAPSSTKALLQKFHERVLGLEEPLADATRLVHALRLIGDGMECDGADEGAPIATVARAAADRLDHLKREWDAARRVGRGR